MKIVLATSPHVRHGAVLQSDFRPDRTVMYSFAPVGLLSLLAVLRNERPGTQCEVYDLNRRVLSGGLPVDRGFYEAAAADMCGESPDVVGFMTECDSYHHILQIAGAIKRLVPSCAVVLGGPHASVVAAKTLRQCDAITAVVVGEGEVTFPRLLDALGRGSGDPISGAVTRGDGLAVVQGGARELVKCLDDLPIPAYDVYRPDAGEEIFIEAGRGCPFQCRFCSTAPYWGRLHRVKSPSRILREVELVRGLFGTTRVHFTHDLFTTNRQWVEAVCAVLIGAGVPMRWTCSARTDTVDEALLALMARAGCNAIYFGIESGSARILREIRKDIPLAQSFDVLAACQRQGITPNVGFIAGFPTEDAESLRDTFHAYERSLRLGCRPVHIFGYCPFAGSSMYAGLDDLRCSGHFVDFPLGMDTDLENRRMIASDPDLYGAYFRPAPAEVVPGEENAIFAVDEFSPLVEAALSPALALAEARGGMYAVFQGWLRWIQARNDGRGAPAYRRGYGTALDFATFLLEELSASDGTKASTLAVARAVQMNLRAAEATSARLSTSMASYRSIALPALETSGVLTLGTRLVRGAIVGRLALEYDVTAVLGGRFDSEPVEQPTYLVWQVVAGGSIRLLRTDEWIFETLERLEWPRTVGEIVLEHVTGESSTGAPASATPVIDPSAMVTSLEVAVREGLITIGGS